jgi:hypothetical protein
MMRDADENILTLVSRIGGTVSMGESAGVQARLFCCYYFGLAGI